MTSANWETLRGSNTTIRFEYLLNRPNFPTTLEPLDSLTLKVNMAGYFEPAIASVGNDVSYEYNSTTGVLTFKFYETDAYKIMYVDTV
jgi:hypothetical protein